MHQVQKHIDYLVVAGGGGGGGRVMVEVEVELAVLENRNSPAQIVIQLLQSMEIHACVILAGITASYSTPLIQSQ